MGIEWGAEGVRVVSIAPGPIEGTVGGPGPLFFFFFFFFFLFLFKTLFLFETDFFFGKAGVFLVELFLRNMLLVKGLRSILILSTLFSFVFVFVFPLFPLFFLYSGEQQQRLIRTQFLSSLSLSLLSLLNSLRSHWEDGGDWMMWLEQLSFWLQMLDPSSTPHKLLSMEDNGTAPLSFINLSRI